MRVFEKKILEQAGNQFLQGDQSGVTGIVSAAYHAFGTNKKSAVTTETSVSEG